MGLIGLMGLMGPDRPQTVNGQPQTANHELFADPGANNVGLVRHDA